MRYFRTLILLLLSLALPVYGYAGLAPLAVACPMQQEMQAQAMQMAAADQHEDCCDHMQLSGKACKTECKTGSLALEFPADTPLLPATLTLPAQFIYLSHSGNKLDYIWRPPTFS